jgi:hypothetical protein
MIFIMLNGLQVAKIAGQIRLICPAHPDAALLTGLSAAAGRPAQYTKSCSTDGCINLAYSDSEESLNQEIQAEGQKIR